MRASKAQCILKKLKKRIGPGILAAAVALVMLTGIIPQAGMNASAASGSPVTVDCSENGVGHIPVTQRIDKNKQSTTVTYTLTPETDGAPMPEGPDSDSYTFRLTGNYSRCVHIPLEAPGIWKYKLEVSESSHQKTDEGHQVTLDGDTFTYPVHEYRITVKSAYSGSGYNGTTVAYNTEEPDSKLGAILYTFTAKNAIDPAPQSQPGTVTAEPRITKEITGDTPDTDTTFQFTLTADNDASKAYMPVSGGDEKNTTGQKTVIHDGAGTADFGRIIFDRAGTYSYTVAEVQGNSLGYTYDKNVYQIVYEVTGTSDLSLKKTVYKKGMLANTKVSDDSETVTFSNKYEKPVIPVSDPSVNKVIDGDDPKQASSFEFTLSAADPENRDSYPMPSGSRNGVKTVTVTGQGSAEFGNITFNAPGTYTYRIAEVKGNSAGYSYDRTVYHAVYRVTEGTGGLSVKHSIFRVDSGGKETPVKTGSSQAKFTNSYTARKNGGTTVSTESASGTAAKTGDPSRMRPYIFMMAAAALVLAGAAAWRRRQNEE